MMLTQPREMQQNVGKTNGLLKWQVLKALSMNAARVCLRSLVKGQGVRVILAGFKVRDRD